MKNGIIGIFASICVLVTIVTVSSIQTSENIKEKIDSALDTAINSTQRVYYDGRLEPESNEEYLAEFNKNLEALIGEEEDIVYKVDVYGVDYEKGLLDLQVRARYKNLIGGWREVTRRKTMIIEVIET